MILSHVFRNSMILGFFKWCFSFILLGGRLHFTICLKKISLHEIENHDGKYLVHLESVFKSGVPTALLYICVIVILSIVFFYKNDLALGMYHY